MEGFGHGVEPFLVEVARIELLRLEFQMWSNQVVGYQMWNNERGAQLGLKRYTIKENEARILTQHHCTGTLLQSILLAAPSQGLFTSNLHAIFPFSFPFTPLAS